jgi:hypothetical protein
MTSIEEADDEDESREVKSPNSQIRLPPTSKQGGKTPLNLSKSPKLVISDRFLARQKAM